MSEYAGAFNKEFLNRTKNIIETHTGEYEATLLLNCTLALICLPIEKLINDNYEIINQVYSKLEELKIPITLKTDLSKEPENNYMIIKALRNGIAHLGIDAVNADKKLSAFIITGTTENFKKKYEFYFTLEKLRKFCDEMLNIYLKYAKSKKRKF